MLSLSKHEEAEHWFDKMEWTDAAILLSARSYGETGIIADLLTREHGRHAGLVRGSKTRALLQPGNGLSVTWRARLPEQLGSYAVELAKARERSLMESRGSLTGLNAFCAVTMAALPEHQAHAPLYNVAEILLDAMVADDFTHWGPLYVRWEAGLLDALGFGLDLSRCAATGATNDLLYVSPRTGRAVSAEAGADYAARLFPLPQFLLDPGNAADRTATRDGLRLTGYFLLERVLEPHGREMPQARVRLETLAGRESD
jgi:DNA repair protein RecO (recombination protein O)